MATAQRPDFDLDTEPFIQVDRGPSVAPKPCCKRLSGARWCYLQDDHLDPTSRHYTPECHGISQREWPLPDHGPMASKARRW